MPRRAEAPLTDEQLRMALRHLWRPGWPEDLQAVLAHPVRGPCVRGLARSLGRAAPTVGTPPQRQGNALAWVPPTPQVPPRPQRLRTGPGSDSPDTLGAWPRRRAFDARRAAANDFDED